MIPQIAIPEAAAKALAFGLKNWKLLTVGALAVALLAQHGCLVHTQHQLRDERAAHKADIQVCKDNDRKAKDAVARANASVEAVRVQGLRDTAAAEKAASEARSAAQRASKTAASILSRKPEAGGVCPSIHALRMEMSR